MMLMAVYLSIFCLLFAVCDTPLAVRSTYGMKTLDSSINKNKVPFFPMPTQEIFAVFMGFPFGLLILRPENAYHIALMSLAFIVMMLGFFYDYTRLPFGWKEFVSKDMKTFIGDHGLEKYDTVKISRISFTNMKMDQFIQEKIKPCIGAEKKCFIVTANPEIVMATRKDPDFKKTVLGADYVVPDGIGIIFAAKYKGHPLNGRIAGFDLMKEMLTLANEQRASCYFLGANKESNTNAVEEIRCSYRNIHIAGNHHGYFDLDDYTLASTIANTNPDFIFVALGYPKQERWIERYQPLFPKGVFMGVGGSLDCLSGKVKRAPDLWIKCNVEWLYRLLKQPFRWRRLLPIVEFVWLVFRKKI